MFVGWSDMGLAGMSFLILGRPLAWSPPSFRFGLVCETWKLFPGSPVLLFRCWFLPLLFSVFLLSVRLVGRYGFLWGVRRVRK